MSLWLSDLYWVDSALPLEKYMNLKQYQVTTSTDNYDHCVYSFAVIMVNLAACFVPITTCIYSSSITFLGWGRSAGKTLLQEICKSKHVLCVNCLH